MEARPHSSRARRVAASDRMIHRFVTAMRRRAIAST